ncbi:MAG: ribbon-helix-helix domain-containing protein [Hyphomicrobiales bacterium]|nr:ribbon-helix-helix domain-containing protein [Hyphomicrobiales bacterium]MDE2116093.1 ribbon-helix-helix domain-containing protein [Hyphomicrobiales bacterium]
MPLKPATTIAKHSVMVAGHRTSISLETAFWDALAETARQRGQAMSTLIAEIDQSRAEANLSSAIRVFVLMQARANQ